MKSGLAAGHLLEGVFARDVPWVAVGGQDVAKRQALQLLGDLLDRQPGVDHDRLLRIRIGHDVSVDLAIELDLQDGELGHPSLCTAMQHAAAVGFAIFLSLVCLFWIYGYIRRRSKNRY